MLLVVVVVVADVETRGSIVELRIGIDFLFVTASLIVLR